MKLSAFTPMGLLRMSAETPMAERIYRTLIGGLGGQFSTEIGSYQDARCFAQARGMARLDRDARRAALQGLPQYAGPLLPIHEKQKGIIPGPTATLAERRAELAARTLISSGSTRGNMESALQALLGSAFVALKTEDVADIVTVSQADGHDVNYAREDVNRKIIRTVGPMVFPAGGAEWIEYEVIESVDDPLVGASDRLVAGETIVLEPGNLGQAERIVIDDVDTEPDRFLANYAKSHDVGTYGFTHPLPCDATTKRHALVIVTSAAAQDPEVRRKIHELMRRIVRDVSTWDVVADGGGGLTQQFQIGVPSIGISHANPAAFP